MTTTNTVDPTARFWDRVADGYARRPIADQATYEKKLALTAEHLRPEARVLEFGCGTGGTALHHASRVAHVHAVDVSARMIAIAREKARATGADNVTFEQGTLEDVAAGGDRFDAVLGLNVMHLLPAWRELLVEVHGLLEPGGVFVSSSLCLAEEHAWLRWIAPLGRPLGLLPQLAFFRGREYLQAHGEAGFGIVHEYRPGPGKGVFLVARRRA